MKYIFIFAACFLWFGCHFKKKDLSTVIMVDYKWLDSVRQSSDTSYSRKYGSYKFATAFYYINNKAASICQVMKDSADTIRQIIITKNNKRNFVAEYYANGQLMAKLPLDSFGQYHGPSLYYYQNGFIESQGSYEHGFKKDSWKNYTEEGKLTDTKEYDSKGNVGKIIGN